MLFLILRQSEARVLKKVVLKKRVQYSRVSNNSGDGIIVADFSKRAKKNKSGDGIIVAEFLNPKMNNSLGIQ